MIIDIPPDQPVSSPESPYSYQPRRYVTVTELTNFARCPRRYFYSAGMGLRRSDEGLMRRNAAAHFGTALGNAIPLWLDTGEFEAAYNEFLRVWADHPQDDRRNPTTAKLMLWNFAQWHPRDSGMYTIKKPAGTSVIRMEDKSPYEIPFAVEIPGLPIPLIGSIDYCAEWRSDRTDWVVECKTSIEMSERFTRGFKRNPQGLAYVLARRSQGYDCKGYIHELLSTAKNPKQPLAIVPTHVKDQDLELFMSWVKELTLRILECEANGVWPQWPSGCGTYPMFYQPGYFCEFDPLCDVPDYRQMLNFYDVKRHEPYVIVTTKGKEIVGMPRGTQAGDD